MLVYLLRLRSPPAVRAHRWLGEGYAKELLYFCIGAVADEAPARRADQPGLRGGEHS